MDLILFGIQGSGKGTIGKAIAKKYGFKIFEAGSELRRLSHEDSELGKKVKEIIEAGHLVSDEVIMEIIEDFLHKLPSDTDVIFDGIPRKISQAGLFDKLMKKLNKNFKAILVEVSEKEAIKRLTTRRICTDCKEVYPAFYKKRKCEKCGGSLITRSDDNPDSIKIRIKAYFKETMPVIAKYKNENKLIVMNGEQSIKDAREDAFKVVEKLIKQNR